jgi:HlyD family secretion protein
MKIFGEEKPTSLELGKSEPVPHAQDAAKIEAERGSASSGWKATARRLRKWPILLLLILALGIAAYLLWPKKSAVEADEPVTVSVKVAKAERGPIAAEVSAVGTIFPRLEATVASKVNAQIKSMPLLTNKTFKAGDPIVVLESRDLNAQRAEAAAALHEAEVNLRNVTTGTIPQTNAQDEKALRDAQANVANARANYERRRTLFEQGGISKKDLDAALLVQQTAENDLRLAESTSNLHKTAINPNDRATAEAKVNEAHNHLGNLDAQLSYATIRAPFSGVVTEQFQFQGEYAAAGGKLFTIADMTEVIVKTPFSDTVASQLTAGDDATVFPQQLPGEQMSGKISLVSRGSDPQNRAVQVWVTLQNENGRLRADSAAKVVVASQEAKDAIIVPASAVTLDATTGDEGTVMVVDDQSIAHQKKVKVGIRTTDKMQIVSGIDGGQTIIVEGNYALKDGTKVEASQEGEDKGEQQGGDEEKDPG